MKRNRRLTVSVITSVLMLLPVFTSTPLQPPTTLHFQPQSLSHRSSQSLLSIKHPNIQTDYWTNMECWGGKLGERVFTVVSIVKPKRCTNVSNLFYFGMTLYMFRTVFPSVIRSSRLYIKQQASVKQILLSAWYISIVKPTRCTNVSNLFYFGMTLYMFRTVFPSIIRSSRLYIKQQAFVKQILLSAWYISIVNPTRCTSVTNLFYFGMSLHVSDGLSVHHQEFKTLHTATGICQTDTAVCTVLELLMMDGRTVRNM